MMIRELARADAVAAIRGGSVLACGGGGWVGHGELMADVATRIGTPVLCSLDEIPDDALVATVTAIGARGAADWEIQPLDYVNGPEGLVRMRCSKTRPSLNPASRAGSTGSQSRTGPTSGSPLANKFSCPARPDRN